MSQHDYNIANAGGAAVRSDMNNALVAIQSQNSGSTAPTSTKPFMTWYDTATGALKMRNAGDTAWISMAEAVAGGQLAGLRNRIINGGCQVAQRGTIAATLGTLTYGGADRIASNLFSFTTASGTIQRIQNASISTDTSYSQSVQITTTGTGTVAFRTRLEANNVKDLSGKTVTITVGFYSDAGSSYSGNIQLFKASAVDNFATITQIGSNITGTVPNVSYTKISGQITLSAADAANGLEVVAYFAAVGAVTSKYFAVGDLQLEIGPVATPFEQRSIGMELALCQRYCFVGRVYVTATGTLGNSPLPVAMRTTMATATITGTGVGFALADSNTNTVLIASQTSASGQTITVSTEL